MNHAIVKAISSGDTLLLMGQKASSNGPPPEKSITLSSLMAPKLGYGDTKVNNTMKNLNKIFYDILYKLDKNDFSSFNEQSDLLNKYFYNNKKINEQNNNKLAKYMDQFNDFCFDLNIDNVLNGSIEFKLK